MSASVLIFPLLPFIPRRLNWTYPLLERLVAGRCAAGQVGAAGLPLVWQVGWWSWTAFWLGNAVEKRLLLLWLLAVFCDLFRLVLLFFVQWCARSSIQVLPNLKRRVDEGRAVNAAAILVGDFLHSAGADVAGCGWPKR